jgi:hypothetical protein
LFIYGGTSTFQFTTAWEISRGVEIDARTN